MPLPPAYDPKVSEPKWQQFWAERGIHAFDPDSKAEVFSIDTPPPTVSGMMHLGHAFGYTQADFIIRYQRMRGKNVLYPFGFDDNGLATERFVEKKLSIKGSRMARPEFVKLCLQETREAEARLLHDFRSLGLACDWAWSYRTIDKDAQAISQASFLDLVKKGRTYRKEAPIMWCPACQTAIAQVETKDREQKSALHYIRVKTEDGHELVYATTRPELLPACVGISVHPDDARYKAHIGRQIRLPLIGRSVPLTPDTATDMAYGSGVVYYCTYGGVECIDWLTRHPGVEPIHLLTPDGRLNEKGGKYRGLTTREAREALVVDLKADGALVKSDPITHVVNVHERCDTEIEYIASVQWFIKYLDLKEKFLELGDQLIWHPPFMKARYDNWIKGLRWDWCISRQRFFGVPFPVWYCACGEILYAQDRDLPVDPTATPPPPCPKCGRRDAAPEKDVLDTWATSSLTPQIALRQRADPAFFAQHFPMTLRPQGHDIVTFWLFNTVVKSYLHHGRLPWTHAAINGFVLAPGGGKMSKSKGNVLDPLVIMETYSADALRFWSASSRLGSDLPYQEKDVQTGKKVITKLWNAARFIEPHLADEAEPKALWPLDRWMLGKLNAAISEATEGFEAYEFLRAKAAAEKFFMQAFCDHYLEIVKDRLYNPDRYPPEAVQSARSALHSALLVTLKLFAPFLPHITEEIYQALLKVEGAPESIHLAPWPTPNPAWADPQSAAAGDLFVDILAAVRKYKSEQQLGLGAQLASLTVEADADAKSLLKPLEQDLCGATRAQSLGWGKGVLPVRDGVKIAISLSQ